MATLAVGPSSLDVSKRKISGNALGVGSLDGQVAILQSADLGRISTLESHRGACTCIFWLSSKSVVTGGSDGVLKCTNLESEPKEMWRLRFGSGIIKAGVSKEYLFLLLKGERAVRRYPRHYFEGDTKRDR